MAEARVSKFKRLQERTIALFDEDGAAPDQLPPWQKFVHFCMFVGRGYISNRLPGRAASLAYTSLLAMVPVLALVISISTSLLKTPQGEQKMRHAINEAILKFAPQLGLQEGQAGEDQRIKVIDYIYESIQNVQ